MDQSASSPSSKASMRMMSSCSCLVCGEGVPVEGAAPLDGSARGGGSLRIGLRETPTLEARVRAPAALAT
eukprot:6455660-Amphidinium_carterae.2